MLLNPEILAQFQTFSLGPLTFHGYGIILGISIAVSLFLFLETIPKSFFKDNLLYTRIAIVIISAIIGGRIVYVAGNLSSYSAISEMIAIWDGGTTIFGVLIGGIGGLALSHRVFKTKNSLLTFTDYAAPVVAIGQSIGRWANFINQELYGFPTDVPWKMYITTANRSREYERYEYFHPTFLYEAILMLFLGITLLRVTKKTPLAKEHPGVITGVYFLSYGFIRFLLERIRIDSTPIIGFFKPADILAVALMIGGVILVIYAKRPKSKKK